MAWYDSIPGAGLLPLDPRDTAWEATRGGVPGRWLSLGDYCPVLCYLASYRAAVKAGLAEPASGDAQSWRDWAARVDREVMRNGPSAYWVVPSPNEARSFMAAVLREPVHGSWPMGLASDFALGGHAAMRIPGAVPAWGGVPLTPYHRFALTTPWGVAAAVRGYAPTVTDLEACRAVDSATPVGLLGWCGVTPVNLQPGVRCELLYVDGLWFRVPSTSFGPLGKLDVFSSLFPYQRLRSKKVLGELVAGLVKLATETVKVYGAATGGGGVADVVAEVFGDVAGFAGVDDGAADVAASVPLEERVNDPAFWQTMVDTVVALPAEEIAPLVESPPAFEEVQALISPFAGPAGVSVDSLAAAGGGLDKLGAGLVALLWYRAVGAL